MPFRFKNVQVGLLNNFDDVGFIISIHLTMNKSILKQQTKIFVRLVYTAGTNKNAFHLFNTS